jgi:hypothetical protein
LNFGKMGADPLDRLPFSFACGAGNPACSRLLGGFSGVTAGP